MPCDQPRERDESPEKKEKCGLFGIWGAKDAAFIAYHALFAQQHRGQESAGIATSSGSELHGHVGMGLVSQVFTPRMLREELVGHAAVGHVRYSTTGSSRLCNAQPLMREYLMGPVAVAHNGNLVNASLLRAEYERHGHIFQSTTDTEIIVHLLAKPSHMDKADPLPHVLKHLQGAYSLLFLFPDRIEAARDPWGVRPLVLGRTHHGHWCVASETCAFDAIGAGYEREVEPGEGKRVERQVERVVAIDARHPVEPGGADIPGTVGSGHPRTPVDRGIDGRAGEGRHQRLVDQAVACQARRHGRGDVLFKANFQMFRLAL